MTEDPQLWQDLLSLFIGALISAGIEFLRRQQKTYPPPGQPPADKDGPCQ